MTDEEKRLEELISEAPERIRDILKERLASLVRYGMADREACFTEGLNGVDNLCLIVVPEVESAVVSVLSDWVDTQEVCDWFNSLYNREKEVGVYMVTGSPWVKELSVVLVRLKLEDWKHKHKKS